jgi:hypothetical protein
MSSKHKKRKLSLEQSLSVMYYGCVGLSKLSDTTLVVHPRLNGSLLTKGEALMFGKAVLKMAKELDEPQRFIPYDAKKQKRKLGRKKRAQNK